MHYSKMRSSRHSQSSRKTNSRNGLVLAAMLGLSELTVANIVALSPKKMQTDTQWSCRMVMETLCR